MRRITDHPALGPLPTGEIGFTFDGEPYQGLESDSIASALLANDVRTLRRSRRNGEPRGIYCGIGHCFECRVTVNGVPSIRACITPVNEGDVVESQEARNPEPQTPDTPGQDGERPDAG